MRDTYALTSFQKELVELEIHLTEEQIGQFLTYYELLTEWNSFMNLTAIIDFKEVLTKHFLDSLSIVNAQKMKKVRSLLDVGTGAGFPGIALKIAFPWLEITLLDSLNKRVTFLNKVIQSLKLEGIRALHGRAEDYGQQPEYREKFELCVSRAVAHLSSLSEYCLPFVKLGGKFISYKSGKIKIEELVQANKAVYLLGGNYEKLICFSLPTTNDERTFVVLIKQRFTPKKYPRKAGIPTKKPLS